VLKPPTVKRPSSSEERDPASRPIATDVDNDPLQSFAPENRQDRQPSVPPTAPNAVAKPRLFDPQAIAGFGVFVDAINDVEKQLKQHLAAIEQRLAALDDRSRHTDERLTAADTLAAEIRASVKALDDSIEMRVAKEIRAAQQHAPTRGVDSLPARAPRQPAWSGMHSLLALGVVAVLALVGIVTMRSRGDVDQTTARTTAPGPIPPAPMVASATTSLVPAALPVPEPAVLTASAAPAASPVSTASSVPTPSADPTASAIPTTSSVRTTPPVPTTSSVRTTPPDPAASPIPASAAGLKASPTRLPTAAAADPPRPGRVASPTNNQVATPQTERPPANREQAGTKPPQRAIERRPEVFLGTLAVRSAPDGAAVFLNGRAVGTTPLKLPGVRAGSYALRIEHEGYQRWTMSVLVPADKQTDINAKLDAPDLRVR